MIINTENSSVELIGDITKFKTGIRPEDLAHITTLLSSNLYSFPEQSFIRETVSNAWDSQVEAGTTDIPILVKIDKWNGEVTVRDYGTGLSPERFKEVYCNIGSSTKRSSNDYIGGFGIGKYSSLAVSNTVYITSYYEGQAYYYVMVKDGNSIITNLVATLPTEEKNGVEITVKNIGNSDAYFKGLDYIIFFPNVFVEGYDYFNNIKIKRFKAFASASIVIDKKILLGNVLYPCDIKHLCKEAQTFISDINRSGIVIQFNIGELNMTPNREQIIYTKETIEIINNRILEAKKELENLILSKLKLDYDDLIEYHKNVNATLYFDAFTEEVCKTFMANYYYYRFSTSDYPLTFKGKKVSPFDISMCGFMLRCKNPAVKAVIYDGTIYMGSRVPYRAQECFYFSAKNVIVLKNSKFSSTLKTYLKSHANVTLLSHFLSFDDFTKLYDSSYSLTGETLFIFKELYNSITKNWKEIDFNNDAKFIAFKEELKNRQVATSILYDRIILYLYIPSANRRGNSKRKLEFNNLDSAIKYIKSLKKGVVIDYIDENNDMISNIATARDFIYITARKSVVDKLKDIKASNIVDLAWLLYKDPMLSKVKAVMEYSALPSYIVETLPFDFQEEYKEVSALYNKFVYCSNYMCHVKDSSGIKPDSYIEGIVKRANEYKETYNRVAGLSPGNFYEEANKAIVGKCLVKTKAYRVNREVLNKLRNNELIQILCKR